VYTDTKNKFKKKNTQHSKINTLEMR